MMAGITFMAAYVNSTVNKYIDVGIDLDEALIIAFVPIVSIPGFVGDKFQFEIFIFRKFVMLECTFATFCNRCFKYRIQFFLWNDKPVGQQLESFRNCSLTRKQAIELSNETLVILFIKHWCCSAEEVFGFIVK